jgi:AraC-like DNA-binding protein
MSASNQQCKDILELHEHTGHLHSRLREVFLESPGKFPSCQWWLRNWGCRSAAFDVMASEGLIYQGLKDQFRVDLSPQLLIAGHMAPKEIAYFLGFSTPSALSRAFKAWTGKTIQQFLQLHGAKFDRLLPSEFETPYIRGSLFHHPLSTASISMSDNCLLKAIISRASSPD